MAFSNVFPTFLEVDGPNGSKIIITTLVTSQAEILVYPPTQPGITIDPADLLAFAQTPGSPQPVLEIDSPRFNGHSGASLFLQGSAADNSLPPQVSLNAVGGSLVIDAQKIFLNDSLAPSSVDILGPWTDYSTAAAPFAGLVVSTGGGQARGNSVYLSRYLKIGRTLFWDVHITIDTTGGFNNGIGIWSIVPPFTLAPSKMGAIPCFIVDNGTALRCGMAVVFDQTHVRLFVDNTLNPLGAGGPAGAGWGTGDEIHFSARLELA